MDLLHLEETKKKCEDKLKVHCTQVKMAAPKNYVTMVPYFSILILKPTRINGPLIRLIIRMKLCRLIYLLLPITV